VGAEVAGAAAAVFATGGAACFRANKKIAATRITAAAEATISVVDFDLAGCSGSDDDDRDVTFAAGAEGSAAGTATVCGIDTVCSVGVVSTLTAGTMTFGTTLDGATLGATLLV
jgi:hypothetical protein